MNQEPLVTVVIPTLQAARTLERCLESVRAQSYSRLEVLVVDARSTDGTGAIAGRYADRVIAADPGLPAQRNVGWRAGAGEIVLHVDADMVLDPRVVEEVVAAFQERPETGAVVIPEVAFGTGFLASCRVLEKQIYLGDATVEAARAFPRTVLEEVGGYNDGMNAFEDWDTPDRVLAAGYELGRIAARVHHDEGRVSLRKQFRKKQRYGRHLPDYRRRRDVAPVRRLARPQLLSRLPVRSHPVRSTGLVLLKGVEFAGILSGAAAARLVGR